MSSIYDSRAFVKRLTEAGMPENQADTLASENLLLIAEHLATKDDFKVIENSITELRAEMQSKIRALEVKMEARFEAIEARLTAIGTQFESINTKFSAIDTQFESISTRFDAIGTQFESIGKKFDAIGMQFEAIEEKIDSQESRIVAKLGVLMGAMVATIAALIQFFLEAVPAIRSGER